MTFAKRFTLYFFSFTGILHFVLPKPFIAIVPDYLPRKRDLVYASGATELGGALMTAHPATRRAGGWLLLATLVGVYPANCDMALNHGKYPQVPGGQKTLIARLPLQFVMGYLVWKATLSKDAADA